MSFRIVNNFNLNSRLYLDARQIKDSLEVLQNGTNVLYPPGFEVYCKLEKKWYQNTADEGMSPIWVERPSGTGGSGNANIDDTNIGTDVTYSNQKIENRLTEVNADITNVADDLIDMDTRVDYLEQKQLETLDNLELTQTSDTTPTDSNVSIWINTSEDAISDVLARINDSIVSKDTVWSSYDTQDYIKTEITNASLGGETEVDLTIYQTKTDNDLNTTNKTVVGGINEIKDAVDNLEIPTKTSELENDSNFITSIPDEYVTETDLTVITDDLGDIDTRVTFLEGEQLKISTFDGSYDSLTGKPTIPTKTSDLENDSGYLTEHQSLDDYTKTTDLSTVATTGSYNDLTDTPSLDFLPLTGGIVEGTTFFKSGAYVTTVADANNAVINKLYFDTNVPTTTSSLTNDSGFITSADIPTIPDSTSDLTNDSGFITINEIEEATDEEINAMLLEIFGGDYSK